MLAIWICLMINIVIPYIYLILYRKSDDSSVTKDKLPLVQKKILIVGAAVSGIALIVNIISIVVSFY